MIIISNPPYKYGSEITKAIIDSINYESFINLMPISNYRNYDLYKHIVASTTLPANAFKDAAVQAHVVVLSKEAKEMSKEEAAILSYREDLQKFYRENLKRKDLYIKGFHGKYKLSRVQDWGIDPDTWFAYTERTGQNGIHKDKNSLDIKWNIYKNSEAIPTTGGSRDPRTQMFFLWAKFPTREAKDNFCKWWYSAGLSDKLVRGLHTTSGTCELAFPQVDWSRPWTDEEILRDYGYKPSEIKKILEN